MKALLINPSRFYDDRSGIGGELSHLFTLFSYLRTHCPTAEVDVLDFDVELGAPRDDVEIAQFLALAKAALRVTPFDVVGISCWTTLHYLSSLEVARLCRELNPDCTIVVGGYHPSSLPHDFTYADSPFDFVVIGEGEVPLTRIVSGELRRQATPQILQGTPSEWSSDLLWGEYKYHQGSRNVGVWLTRGCPFSCGYCLDRLTKWRGYPPERAVEEIRRIHDKLPSVRHVNLMDPIFGLNPAWRRAFLDGLVAADLDLQYWGETRGDILEEDDIRKLGQLRVQMDIGIDAVTPALIEIMMKARHPQTYLKAFLRTDELMTRYEVPHFIFIILNYPGETPETLDETQAFWEYYYRERAGGWGAVWTSPFKFFPGCELFNNFASYEKRYGTRVLHPAWWKLRRPRQIELASQVVASRALAEAGKIQYHQVVKDAVESLGRSQTSPAFRQFLAERWNPAPDVLAGGAGYYQRPFALGDDTHLHKLENGHGFLFHFGSSTGYICTERETRWMDELQAAGPGGARTDEPDGERNEFLRKMIRMNYVKAALAAPASVRLEPAASYRAILHTTVGTLEFELLTGEAPRTAANFIHLCRAGHYSDLLFEESHAGAYLTIGSHLSTAPPPYVLSPDEPTHRLTRRGSLWMSITLDGTRFSICRDAWPTFDRRGTVFGELLSGEEVLDQLGKGHAILRAEIVAAPLPS